MLTRDFGTSLNTNKVSDARRRGARTEAYEQYVAGTSDRRQHSRWHFDGGSGYFFRLSTLEHNQNRSEDCNKSHSIFQLIMEGLFHFGEEKHWLGWIWHNFIQHAHELRLFTSFWIVFSYQSFEWLYDLWKIFRQYWIFHTWQKTCFITNFPI